MKKFKGRTIKSLMEEAENLVHNLSKNYKQTDPDVIRISDICDYIGWNLYEANVKPLSYYIDRLNIKE